jgi:hypothetical protein
MTTDVAGFIAAGRLPDVGVGEEVGVDVDEAGFGGSSDPATLALGVLVALTRRKPAAEVPSTNPTRVDTATGG